MYSFGECKLFDDVRQLSQGKCDDYSTTDAGEQVDVPQFSVAVGGFPCKARSTGAGRVQRCMCPMRFKTGLKRRPQPLDKSMAYTEGVPTRVMNS